MDFGGVLDSGVVVACSDTKTATITAAAATSNALFTAASEAVSEAETKQKWYGSVGFFKQERTSGANHAAEDDMRGSKMAKTTAAALPRSPFVGSEPHQMLSFSSSSSSPYYPHASFGGNPGYGVAGLSGGNMHGVMSGGVKGPFTPSQWMELEHQALIYKYIIANVPIPPYLLNPIKKAIESAALSSFGLRVNSLGWGGAGGFHLGFSSNTDPEPGRCRRTDGKKWRCSRDAVADQKYCERHMNRGRHRSRKPVESPSGHHPASGTTTTTAAAAKPMPGASSTSSSAAAAVAVSGGGASNSLAFSHHNQLSNLQLPAATNPSVSAHHLDSRSFLDKEYAGERYQDPTGLSITPPILKDRQYSSIPKDQNPYEESSTLKFGLVCSDSLLSKGSSLVSCRNYGTSEVVSDRENKSQHPIRQFMDNWPKNQSDRSMVLWPEIDMQQKPDSTQLSISIPMATSEFMSSISPANEKLNACPLKLSREIEATQMRLGVGAVINEQNPRQGNWIPIPWESSMGGPLGEVLHGTNSMTSECKNPSALNLMTEGWNGNGSPKPASSPTGVLQKAVFYSISNSSAGSSPRAESNKNTNGASPSNEILGATLMNPSLPAL
ncbi:growth-regulating factor 1-like isoform X1 [Ipomoea triloba]|uniref:growth-regulating factor 1-like isoform X1 n=1 Tax=Ipomoea triloba TaxID=35885 RepID=UPI00125E2A90|nr:growth-regulating factor 1-like isoform X1 [Ipomoea triloba]